MTIEVVKEKLVGLSKKGDIKKLAKEIKIDHQLGLELWNEKEFHSMLLAVLIFDKKQIDEAFIKALSLSVDVLAEEEKNYVSDWLLANQLTKAAHTKKLMETWIDHDSAFFRRLFWYYQGRLRWTGKTDHDNTDYLVKEIKKRLGKEKPEVQWAINLCAGWIGVYVLEYRDELSTFGKELGLYEEEKAPKHCTPNYLPDFIKIEVGKRE
jgi:3-methyladenine DNA glycosylase AlkD